jgi:hypothetical protein
MTGWGTAQPAMDIGPRRFGLSPITQQAFASIDTYLNAMGRAGGRAAVARR